MKKWLVIRTLIFTILCSISLLTMTEAQAASNLSDGTYSISYTVKQAENDSVSIANDYWEKPATVLVANGVMTLQMKLNHSKWVTQFKVPVNDQFTETKVISSDSNADTRVTEFKVKDLSTPLAAKIHVTVESLDYDHDYTVRFVFDSKSIKSVPTAESTAGTKSVAIVDTMNGNGQSTAPAVKSSDAEGKAVPKKTVTSNPQTGDHAPIAVLVVLLLASSFFLARKLIKR